MTIERPSIWQLMRIAIGGWLLFVVWPQVGLAEHCEVVDRPVFGLYESEPEPTPDAVSELGLEVPQEFFGEFFEEIFGTSPPAVAVRLRLTENCPTDPANHLSTGFRFDPVDRPSVVNIALIVLETRLNAIEEASPRPLLRSSRLDRPPKR